MLNMTIFICREAAQIQVFCVNKIALPVKMHLLLNIK